MDDLGNKRDGGGWIDEVEKYANQYTPENSRAFANQVEEFATSELPPAFNHAGKDFISPLADTALNSIRERIGDNSSAVTFIDLQQIITNEIKDLEDQQIQFSGKAFDQIAQTIKHFEFIEKAVVKTVTNKELDTLDRDAINWYLSRNIERWNKKTQTNSENPDEISAQNESYFASLHEKSVRNKNVTSENPYE